VELAINFISGVIGAAGAAATASVIGRRKVDEARRDPMTGLDTRVGFETKARKALAQGACAVVMIDLDGLKKVNDSKGHEEGDRFICDAAAQLKHWLSERAIIARLGGDEFAAIYPLNQFDERDLDEIVKAIPMSMGLVVARKGDDYSVVLRAADAAMYLSKSRGKGQWTGLGLATSVPAGAGGREQRRGQKNHK